MGWNCDQTKQWYVCDKRKKFDCRARAAIVRQEVLHEEDGQVDVKTFLVQVAPPESHNHQSNQAKIIAEELLVKMKQKVEEDVSTPVGKIREDVLVQELAQYDTQGRVHFILICNVMDWSS